MSSEWVPMRWPCGPLDQEQSKNVPAVQDALESWLDPKSLAFLEGGPVNAIVVTWASGSPQDAAQQTALKPLIAEAKRRGIVVIGRVTAQAPDTAQKASAAGLSAIIANGAVAPAARLRVIPAVEPQGANVPGLVTVAITRATWPRIPTQWRTREGKREEGSEAGPTGSPWVDANGWKVALAAAKAPGKEIWVMAEPPEDVVGYRPQHYALAVADSAVYGGTWMVAFDAETRKALAAGAGKDVWNAVTNAMRFFASHRPWIEQPDMARLGFVSDFAGPNKVIGEELLNLAARRHLCYRIIDRQRLNAASLSGLKAVLWLDQKAPEGPTNTVLSNFVITGGLLIGPASASALVSGKSSGSFENRFDYYADGKGRVALATKPWTDPWLLAADTHLLLGRRHDLIRTFNAGSWNVRYTGGPTRGVAHLINYTARPSGDPPSLYVAQPYKTARFTTLEDTNGRPLEVKPKGDGVEVYLPQFSPYAAVEFGG